MRFLLAFLLVFSMSASAEFGLFNRSVSPDGLGDIKDGVNEVFSQKVTQTTGSTISKGYLVTLNSSGQDGSKVSLWGGEQFYRRPLCVMAEDCESGKFCKCTTYGFVADGCYWDGGQDATVHYPMRLSATAGMARAVDLASINASDVKFGFFMESVDGDGVGTSQGLVDCFIDLR